MGSGFESGRSRLKVVVWRLVWAQVGVTLGAAAVTGMFVGCSSARSVVLGGLAVCVPAALGALRMVLARSDTPQSALRTQVSAQALKWVGTVMVFGAAFTVFRDVQAPWVFLGFGVVQLAYWLALLLER